MAHLWIQGPGGWDAQRLDGSGFDLAAAQFHSAPRDEPTAPGKPGAALVRAEAGGSKVWALIVSANSNSRVNSRLLPAGLCVLADRDEIRFGGEVQYFSIETLAAAVDFPGADRPVFCGRCRQQIDAGTPAVCCPGCGIWYNQSGELPQSSVFLTATGPSSS